MLACWLAGTLGDYAWLTFLPFFVPFRLPRPPLNDVSVNAASDGPGDAKRARLGDV